MHVVNRVPALYKYSWDKRAVMVAVSTYAASHAASYVYWNVSGNMNTVKQILDGAPVWTNKSEVPELDKLFFFLDDDKNYEPSLWHHGLNSISRPKELFRNVEPESK